MKRIVRRFIILLVLLLFSTGCNIFYYGRPTDYTNTRWVSESPDMFFEVGDSHTVVYTQIIIDNEIFILKTGFDHSIIVTFEDASGFDFETGQLLPGLSNDDTLLFYGRGRFSPTKLVLHSIWNDKGFLDDSIKEIVFIREDIDSVEGEP